MSNSNLGGAGPEEPGGGVRFLAQLVRRTAREFQDDDCMHMAAGVAYYALFSLFPLALGLIAVLGLVVDSAVVQARIIAGLADYLPGSSDFIKGALVGLVESRGTLGGLAVLGLFWSANAIFAALRRSINRAWDVPRERPLLQQKLIELGMMSCVGLLLLASLGSAVGLRFLDNAFDGTLPASPLARVLLSGIGAVAVFLVVLLTYKVLPNTRVAWSDIWPSALLVTLSFEAGKRVFLWYVETQALRSFSLTYGPLTAVMVLLLWTYLSAIVLLAGAELASELGRIRAGRSRGTTVDRSGDQTDSLTFVPK
ncbi:MAG: YihY/virulence factor BrkB family protein [Chloroflexi bacterium]|nr:YihY/virulence factor BrkB family protein [Chloroflexota bacterium]